MTAPAAPVIRVHSNGGTLRVHFAAVAGAANYRLYTGSTTAPTQQCGSDVAANTGADGFQQITSAFDQSPLYVRLTAVNAGAEESGYSNEVGLRGWGEGRTQFDYHDSR